MATPKSQLSYLIYHLILFDGTLLGFAQKLEQ